MILKFIVGYIITFVIEIIIVSIIYHKFIKK
jgi:hypothetical protein